MGFLIVCYLVFLLSFGSLIVCAVEGSWIAAYSTKDLGLIYFLLMIASLLFIYIFFNLVFATPIN